MSPSVAQFEAVITSAAEQSADGTRSLPQLGEWYALYTKSRHEKVVHRTVREKGMDSFLPLREVLSQWKDRRKLVEKALFPGYLFVRAQQCELNRVTAIRGVAYVLGNSGGPLPVPDDQVQAVRRMVEGPYPVVPWPWLRKGKRVRVTAGPLAGLETCIVARSAGRKCHLVLTVDLLGRSIAVEMDPCCVEPIP